MKEQTALPRSTERPSFAGILDVFGCDFSRNCVKRREAQSPNYERMLNIVEKAENHSRIHQVLPDLYGCDIRRSDRQHSNSCQ